MRAVGVRELKNRLSEYLRRIRAGEAILVTDHGEVVAEIRRPAESFRDAPYPKLALPAEAGMAKLGAPSRVDLNLSLESALPPGTAKMLLDEERWDR